MAGGAIFMAHLAVLQLGVVGIWAGLQAHPHTSDRKVRAGRYAGQPLDEVVRLAAVARRGFRSVARHTTRMAGSDSNEYLPDAPALRRWTADHASRNVEVNLSG